MSSAVRLPRRMWGIIGVVSLGSFMTMLDSSIVNVALRDLSSEMGASLPEIQWIVTGYLLAAAAALPVSGWLATRFGARRAFVAGIGLFTVASLACALVDSTGWLVVFRALQGLSAFVGPVSTTILVTAAGPDLMARTMSMNAVPVLLAPTIGPTIGGLLLDHAGWRWIFLVNIPVGLLAMGLALRLLPTEEGVARKAPDLVGLAAVLAGSVTVTYGLAMVGSNGRLGSPQVLIVLGAGIVLLVAFVARSLVAEFPILDIRLFANRLYSAAWVTSFFLGSIVFGSIILIPLYLQAVRGASALTTGLLLMPQGLAIVVAMSIAPRMLERWGAGLTTVAGGVLAALATVPFGLVGEHTSFALLLPALVLRGFGIGLTTIPSLTLAFQAAGTAKTSDASVQVTMGQRLGGSLGAALLAVVLTDALEAVRTQSEQAAAYGTAFWWTLGLTLAATAPAMFVAVAARRAPTQASTARVAPKEV